MNYLNFMNINLSDEDNRIVEEYMLQFKDDNKYSVYSKIVICFEENDYDRFIDNNIDLDCFVWCHQHDDNKYQYILYTIDENAYEDVVSILNDYKCNIIQFIVDIDNDILQEEFVKV